MVAAARPFCSYEVTNGERDKKNISQRLETALGVFGCV